MFSQNGTVKIGDFGLVTSEIEDDAENQKERRGYKGTPSYMAPEQVRAAVGMSLKYFMDCQWVCVAFANSVLFYNRRNGGFMTGRSTYLLWVLYFLNSFGTYPLCTRKKK